LELLRIKNLKYIFILALFASFLLSCASSPGPNINEPGSKYPIYIVHGLIERNDILYPNFSLRVVKYLSNKGYVVFSSNTDAFGTIEDNAAKIKEQILDILREHPEFEKVNVLAYSKGGLEARYAISRLGMDDYIASLTMICTPNRGASSVEFMQNNFFFYGKFFEFLVNTGGYLLGDTNPDYLKILSSMTKLSMIEFNYKTKDSEKVQYYSFGADMTGQYLNIPFSFFWKLTSEKEGPNDGIVSIASAKWGTYLGTVNDFMQIQRGITHLDVAGLGLLARSEYDPDLFILKLAQFLYAEGY